jgi:outer membrane lipoprotein carrier protein
MRKRGGFFGSPPDAALDSREGPETRLNWKFTKQGIRLDRILKALILLMFATGFLLAPGTFARAIASDHAKADHNDKLAAILTRVQNHYQKTNTLKAKFTENIAAADGRKRDRSGTVYYRKPGKMRWDFDGTETETIVSDGKELYTYASDLNQVMKAPLARVFKSSAPVAFLLGVGDIKHDFTASLPASPPADGLVHVDLTPRKGGELIEVGLDPKSYDLVWMKITDQLGNSTTLRLIDPQTNIALQDSLFVFDPPKGADIVEAPGAP